MKIQRYRVGVEYSKFLEGFTPPPAAPRLYFSPEINKFLKEAMKVFGEGGGAKPFQVLISQFTSKQYFYFV